MFAATGYKMLKYYKETGFESKDFNVLIIGNIVAFVVALLAIRSFVGYVTKHGFKVFGYYRIVVGAAIIVLYMLGYELKIV